ncbi:MAG: tubulin-like doman-containing protein [Candidatus Ozemobacteraceae bacterium]
MQQQNDTGILKINPTLFIGIGSTGVEVLRYLQDMIYDEYLDENCSPFRMVAIASSENDSQKLAHRYAQTIYVNIKAMSTIRNSVQSPNTDYDRYLQEWLPKSVFDHTSFTDGSANMRAVGRLHLWENSREISRAITQQWDSIKDPTKHQAFLKKLQPRLGQVEISRDEANVFVVGSLVGGTCSGMVWEMGYLARNLCSGACKVKVHGIFTVPDFGQTLNDKNKVLCANSYAALMELNFFAYYDGARRPVKPTLCIPNLKNLEGTPYNTIYLESCSNNKNLNMIKPDAVDRDPEALSAMIATYLFLSVSANAGAAVNAQTVDGGMVIGPTGAQVKLPDPITGYPRSFFSFGICSISYPRYRIAKSVACKILEEVLAGYVNSMAQPKSLDSEEEKLVGAARDAIVSDVRSILQSALDNHLDVLQNTPEEWTLRWRECAGEDIKALLHELPGGSRGGETYETQVGQNGKLMQLLRECEKAVLSAVSTQMGDFVKGLLTRKITLDRVIACITDLGEKLQGLCKGQEAFSGSIAFDELDPLIEKVEQIEGCWLHSIVFLQQQAIDERKDAILKQFKKVVQNAGSGVRKAVAKELLSHAVSAFFDEKHNDSRSRWMKWAQQWLANIFEGVHQNRAYIEERLARNPKNVWVITSGPIPELIRTPERLKAWVADEIERICAVVRKNSDITNGFALLDLLDSIAGKQPPDRSWSETNFLEKLDSLLIREKQQPTNWGRVCDEALDITAQKVLDVIEGNNEFRVDFDQLALKEHEKKTTSDLAALANYSSFYLEMEPGYATRDRVDMRASLFILAPGLQTGDNYLKFQGEFTGDSKVLKLPGVRHWMAFVNIESGIHTQQIKAMENFCSAYDFCATKNTQEVYWNEKEWRIRRIDFQQEDRFKFLRFLLDSTKFVFGTDSLMDANNNPFWEFDREIPFCMVPADVTKSDPIRLFAEENQYKETSNHARYYFIVQYLLDRLQKCLAKENDESFQDKCSKRRIQVESERREYELTIGGGERNISEDARSKLLGLWQRQEDVRIYRVFVFKYLFNKPLEEQDKNALKDGCDVLIGRENSHLDFGYITRTAARLLLKNTDAK